MTRQTSKFQQKRRRKKKRRAKYSHAKGHIMTNNFQTLNKGHNDMSSTNQQTSERASGRSTQPNPPNRPTAQRRQKSQIPLQQIENHDSSRFITTTQTSPSNITHNTKTNKEISMNNERSLRLINQSIG